MSDEIIDVPINDTDYNYVNHICNCGRKIMKKEHQEKGICRICLGEPEEYTGGYCLKPLPDYSDVL